jgi:hypothetical protein
MTAKPISIKALLSRSGGSAAKGVGITSGDLLVEDVSECGVPDEETAGAERPLTPEQKSAEGVVGRASG